MFQKDSRKDVYAGSVLYKMATANISLGLLRISIVDFITRGNRLFVCEWSSTWIQFPLEFPQFAHVNIAVIRREFFERVLPRIFTFNLTNTQRRYFRMLDNYSGMISTTQGYAICPICMHLVESLRNGEDFNLEERLHPSATLNGSNISRNLDNRRGSSFGNNWRTAGNFNSGIYSLNLPFFSSLEQSGNESSHTVYNDDNHELQDIENALGIDLNLDAGIDQVVPNVAMDENNMHALPEDGDQLYDIIVHKPRFHG